MPAKYQPTRGGASSRSDNADTTCHLRDENTDCEDEQEVETTAPLPGCQTRFTARKQAANPQFDKRNDASTDRSSSSSDSPDSDEGSDNEAICSLTKDTEALRGDYPFTPANFTRVVRKAYRQDKPLKLFVEQLGPFVDRAITTILEPYKHLHARMDDMEVRVNDKLKDVIVPELERAVAELKKAQNDFMKLQQEQQNPKFSLDEFEESEDDAPFIDLLGEQPKATKKCLRDDIGDEGESHKKKSISAANRRRLSCKRL
ncbi:hypothetical protein HAX54_001949 [Datura stramonium]|uniref:Uncharacterized protein n=1 Tax=Datura stramonium TaxID=4076 RepID=A0ABS8T350_DATST|nr:hypothetical protein [Datura stramonium]